MSQSLVKRQFLLDDVMCECWIFRVVDGDGRESFWFKGHDVAAFLGYQRTRDAIINHVKSKWKKTWQELKGAAKHGTIEEPRKWQPHSVFIAEPGLYALISRSKLPVADKFTDWVYEEVLPSLRRYEKCIVDPKEKDRKINELSNVIMRSNKALIHANHQLIVLSHRMADIAQDVNVMRVYNRIDA